MAAPISDFNSNYTNKAFDPSPELDLPKLPETEYIEKNDEHLPSKVKKKNFINQYGGICLALVASVLFSSILVLAKMVQDEGLGFSETSFFRYLGVLVPSIPLLLFFEYRGSVRRKDQQKLVEENSNGEKENGSQKRKTVFESVWPLDCWERKLNAVGLLFRGIFSAGAVLLRFSAVNYISVGDAAVISFGSPTLVTILAHFFLNEKTGVVSILTSIAALVGVFIISRPPMLTGAEGFDTQVLIGTGMAFGSMVCTACAVLIGRKVRSVQFSLQLFVFGAIGVIQSTIISMIVTKGSFVFLHDLKSTFLVLGIAGLAFFAQMTMVLALKLETAGIVSLVRSCDVICGFFLQFAVFAVAPDLFSYLGATIILSGVVLMGFRKYLATLPNDGSNRLRQHLGFLI